MKLLTITIARSVLSNMASNSGRVVNYSVRPAKNIERKMIRDLLLRMQPFGELSNYAYVGFGAKYFVDFILFHKHLHISDMVSIEKDVVNRDRYEFNKPFGCIRIEHGQSNEVLPRLDYKKKIICWLDYDGVINNSVLTDAAIFLENACSGSVFAVSYNSTPLKLAEIRRGCGDFESKDRELVRKLLGESVRDELLPAELPDEGLAKPHIYSRILRRILYNQINKTLIDKNSALSVGERWHFKQIMYFDYQDGACMSTVGGVLVQEKDMGRYEDCCFSGLECFRDEDDAYPIIVPNLTIKELNKLRESMPIVEGNFPKGLSPSTFAEKDVSSFARVYKYFPSFSEVEG